MTSAALGACALLLIPSINTQVSAAATINEWIINTIFSVFLALNKFLGKVSFTQELKLHKAKQS